MSPLLENKTILVVDDNEDIRSLLKAILEQAGASVTTAQSVREAIDVFRNSPPHAVVLDIRLGISDGYALINEIRKINTEYRGSTPAIAVTGFASPEDEERAKSAGFAAYFSKPFDPDALVRTMSTVLAGPLNRVA
jgi:CheY-like chemotaxis protein